MAQPKLSGDNVRAYLRDIGRIPLLEHEEEILLGRKVQRLMTLLEMKSELSLDNDGLADAMDVPIKQIKKELRDGEKAKEKMVTANLRLVVSVAKKYTKRNMELLDIIQEGTIGLVRGVEKFDPGRGYKFSTYAYWWIRQGITRAIAEKSRAIRLPIHITENLNRLKKAQRELSQLNGEMPNIKQLSAELGLTEEEIKDLMCKARQPTSLEIKIGENRDTALIDLLEDESQLPDLLLSRSCIKDDIRELIKDLPEMQAAVISMRYGIGEDVLEPMSMTAIGQILNMSRSSADIGSTFYDTASSRVQQGQRIDVTDQIRLYHDLYGGSDNTQAGGLAASKSLNYAPAPTLQQAQPVKTTVYPFTFKLMGQVGLFGAENYYVRVEVDLLTPLNPEFEEAGWQPADIEYGSPTTINTYESEVIDF